MIVDGKLEVQVEEETTTAADYIALGERRAVV